MLKGKLAEKLVEKLLSPGLDGITIELHRARAVVFDLAEIPVEKRSQEKQEKLNKARAAFAQAEAKLNEAKAEHAGLVALTGLLASAAQAGQDTAALEQALAEKLGVEYSREDQGQESAQAQASGSDQSKSRANGDGTQSGIFTVLEARPGKSEGTIRAYCQAEDGQKVAVYGKNGNGQALAGNIGKQVNIRFRHLDKGLFAVSVQPVEG